MKTPLTLQTTGATLLKNQGISTLFAQKKSLVKRMLKVQLKLIIFRVPVNALCGLILKQCPVLTLIPQVNNNHLQVVIAR